VAPVIALTSRQLGSIIQRVSDDKHPTRGTKTGRWTQPRLKVGLSGMIGLLGCALLSAIAAWLVASGRVKVWLPFGWASLVLGLLLAAFSIAEIPLMVFAMRRLLAERPDNTRFVLGLNALFVLFAAVYGIPLILLTGFVGWGLAICALGLVRFGASLLFVVPPRREPASHV
jgi:hypothetical protein